MSSISVKYPEQRRVTITSKRQFTIPQRFYSELGFDREAVCIMGEGMLIICPAAKITDGEFSEQILTELIEEGYSGAELLSEFKRRQARVRPAVETLLENAKMVAEGRAEYSTYEDVFGKD